MTGASTDGSRGDRLALIRWQFDAGRRLLQLHLGSLTDEICTWEPAGGSWTVHRRGGRWHADWEQPEPVPPPPTTIARHLWQVGALFTVVSDQVLQEGERRMTDVAWPGSLTAATAWLTDGLRRWEGLLNGLSETDLDRRLGGGRPGWPFARTAAWMNLELIKNAAEVGTIRRIRHAAERG